MPEQRHITSGFYRYLPFAIFMAFIGLDEVIRFLASHGLIMLGETALYYLYPVKTFIVAYFLFKFRAEYRELSFKDLTNLPVTLAAFGTGLLVFFLWIHMDWTFGVATRPHGFNPSLLPGVKLRIIMTLVRASGAVFVVPLMEELFWRSFLIRYIIARDFENVPLGFFTWPSFILTVLFFGVEHSFILAGIMAGVFYNLLLYRSHSLSQCVLAHAFTNLALASYVMLTGKWYFW
jgi:uncharacterized protein